MSKQNIIGIYKSSILLISFGSIIVLGLIWLALEYNQFVETSDQIRRDYVQNRKTLIKEEVNRVVDYVSHRRSMTQEMIHEYLKEKVDYAYNIANTIYEYNKGEKEKAEIEQLIIKALSNIRFNSGTGYYFAFNLNGTEKIFPNKPPSKTASILLLNDNNSKQVIKDMIDIVNKQDTGFYKYDWQKPLLDTLKYVKLAYVRKFAPLNWVIGTGEYLDDFNKYEQNQLLQWISQIRFDKGKGYFFVDNYNGSSMVQGDSILINEKLKNRKDFFGKNIIELERNAVKNTEGDYIYYHWKQNDFDKEESPKVSFVRGIPELRWMIGAGVFLNDVENIIARNKSNLEKRILERIFLLFLLFAIILTVVLTFSKSFYSHMNKTINEFNSFFASAVHSNIQIDIDKIPFTEFATIAETANKMTAEREKMSRELQENEMRLQLAMEATNDAVWDYNIVTNKTYRSARFAEMLGYNLSNLPQSDEYFFHSIHPLDYENIVQSLNNYIEYPTGSFTLEYRQITKDGNWKWIQTRGKCVEFNDDGTAGRLLGTNTDITERKSHEAEITLLNQELEDRVIERTAQLEDALEELRFENEERSRTQEALIKTKVELSNALIKEKDLSELKTRFISMISHEYRTPLTVILTTSYLLQKYFENQDEIHFKTQIKQIENTVAEMTTLLENVLFIGRDDAGMLSKSYFYIDMVGYLQALAMNANVMNKKGHEIELTSST